MGTSSKTNYWIVAAIISISIAFLLHLIAIGAPWWASTKPSEATRLEHIGLWKYCVYPVGGGDSCNDFVDIVTADWIRAAEAFMVLALFTYLPSLFMVGVCAFMSEYQDNLKVLVLTITFVSITGLFTLIVIATFGDKYQAYFDNKEELWRGQHVARLDWAFGLASTDCILLAICVSCLVGSIATE